MKVSILAQIDGMNSHALHLTQLVKRLPNHGIETIVRPIKQFPGADPEVLRRVQTGQNDCEVELIIGQPKLAPTPGKKTIYLAAWESTRLPEHCVGILNSCALVIAPSNFCAQVFSSCGVTAPIAVVPLGVSEAFEYRRLPESEHFSFYCVGNLGNGPQRKGIDRIIGHFIKAFPNGEKVVLNVKLHPGQVIDVRGDKRINVCANFYDERHWVHNVAMCHCLIHYGVGAFELPVLEAMAIGRPVIAPQWGGHADYFNSDNGIVVQHNLVPAGDSWRGLGHWAEVDEGAAIDAMRWVVKESNSDPMIEIGHAAKEVGYRLTWGNHVLQIATAIKSLLSPRVEIQGSGPVKNRFVMLRRFGDIMALLPLLKKIADKEGSPVELVVHEQFDSVLDGVSYVKPIIWLGHIEDAAGAARTHNAVIAQMPGFGKFNHSTEHCMKSPWKNLGHEWDKYAPLVFDKRDYAREAALATKVFKTDKPKVLVNFTSASSPFSSLHAGTLYLEIEKAFPGAEVVILDKVKADRIYDLLGLYDRASVLVTVDTATLWLAGASSVPVIQLVNDKEYFASPPRGNCVLRGAYSFVKFGTGNILEKIRAALYPNKAETMVSVCRKYTSPSKEAARREFRATPTREVIEQRIWYSSVTGRNSAAIGDERAVPYVRDMVETVLSMCMEDIVVLHNNDIAFDPGLPAAIKDSCERYGCYWAYRVEKKGGTPDGGCDLFAFTRKWWSLHQHQFPDFLLGYRWWDNVLRRLMKWSGCPEGDRLYYHEPHGNNAMSPERLASPGDKHNVKLAEAWRRQWDEPLADTDDTKLYAKPVVWVYAICWNENPMIEFFLRHYSTFADKIIIYDEQSTDGTREIIAKYRKAELREWPHKGLDDVKFTEAVNSCWKEARGQADWVMWPDIDELLYHPDPLRALANADGDVIPSLGYALISEQRFPFLNVAMFPRQVYELVRTGVPQDNYDKQIIWRPELDLQHTVGRHTYGYDWPSHKGKVADVKFKLLHCHHVGGVEATRKKNQRNFWRAEDKRFAWNYHADHDKPDQVGTVAWVRDAIENNKLREVMP